MTGSQLLTTGTDTSNQPSPNNEEELIRKISQTRKKARKLLENEATEVDKVLQFQSRSGSSNATVAAFDETDLLFPNCAQIVKRMSQREQIKIKVGSAKL